jgi:spore germination protein KC
VFKRKGLLIFLITILMYIYIKSNITSVPIEELQIVSSFGQDVVSNAHKDQVYISPTTGYNYRTKPASSLLLTAQGRTVGEIRENKQLIRDKKFLFGLEKVVVAGENFAKYGIANWIDAFFQSPLVNDTAYLIVSKESPDSLLNLKIPGYPAAADYIEGVVKYSAEYHFFFK